MFVRKVSMRLKADAASEFIRKMESEIIPLLREQKGFLDEMTLLAQSGKEVYAYSFWESSTDAEKYDKNEFARVTGLLSGRNRGSPPRAHLHGGKLHFSQDGRRVAS